MNGLSNSNKEKTVIEGSGTAVVFPGQGSQRHGMGKDFYDAIPVCRDIYNEASDVLGWDVAAMCFGNDERLNLTEYAQPCILTTEIAMYTGLQSLYEFKPEYFGGHSLGEYTALVAADVVPFSKALEIVSLRGHLMQEAMPAGAGGMAAVISQDLDVTIIAETLKELPIDVANDNSPNQVVISGHSGSLPLAEQRLTAVFGNGESFRFVPLNVSAPFHSRFMNAMREAFNEALQKLLMLLTPGNAHKVTSNFTGLFHSNDRRAIIERLTAQLSGTVRWRENMKVIAERAHSIFEVGPSRPLREFFKTTGVQCQSIITLSAAARLFEQKLS
ncbi:MAG TPA: acyltransferase domain-containing protein [Deltaproteobacteria bacterium]|nr:acyltransferase domain-containing protein [Deltaproteobacteria bacterium]